MHPVMIASSLEMLLSWKVLSFLYLLNISVGTYMVNLYCYCMLFCYLCTMFFVNYVP